MNNESGQYCTFLGVPCCKPYVPGGNFLHDNFSEGYLADHKKNHYKSRIPEKLSRMNVGNVVSLGKLNPYYCYPIVITRGDCQRPCFEQLNAHVLEQLLFWYARSADQNKAAYNRPLVYYLGIFIARKKERSVCVQRT